MADGFPSKLVDVKGTGDVTRFERRLESLAGRALPDLAWAAVQMVKLTAVAMMVNPVASCVTAVAGLCASLIVRGRETRRLERLTASMDTALSFDLSGTEGRQAMNKAVGAKQPYIVDDIIWMSKTAGMQVPPVVCFVKNTSEHDRAVRYQASVVRNKGGRGIILLGAGLTVLEPQELRAQAATQIARLALQQDKRAMAATGHRHFSALVGSLTVAFALTTGTSPVHALMRAPKADKLHTVFGTLGFLGVAGIAGLTAGRRRRRYEESVADRGAILLTGDTKAMLSSVKKAGSAANTVLDPNVASGFGPIYRVAEFAGLVPSDDRGRYRAIEAFGKAYAPFCTQRADQLAVTFKIVANDAPAAAQPPEKKADSKPPAPQ